MFPQKKFGNSIKRNGKIGKILNCRSKVTLHTKVTLKFRFYLKS